MKKQIVLDFIKNINEHNVDGLVQLMTHDHKFIDAHGEEFQGREIMRNAWIRYFTLFPDYTIEIKQIIEAKDIIGIFGFASGTYQGKKSSENQNIWKLPAAWRVVIENQKVKEWQVYCDTKIVFDIIERNK